MLLPDIVEVTFKRNRKVCCYNIDKLELRISDYVLIEVDKGIDLGQVTYIGNVELPEDCNEDYGKIIRKATENDLKRLQDNRKKEDLAFAVCRQKISEHNLNMKLVDAEYQFDENKLTFFFTSDRRVDFRELVRDLAAKYRTRIELRQIGVREEARKIGGVGICGKSICCSSFLQEFSPISTQDARQQNLTMNPAKLSGLCGRLKCCMLFEKDFYTQCLENYPPLETPIHTDRGLGYVDRIDIFNETIFLRFSDDEYELYSLSEIKALMQLTARSG